jgi:methylphosphotriester-DNA--protein-cysteine methyltransferase
MRRCAVNIVIALAILVPLSSLKAQMVYKTPSGQKYHLATCRSVKNVSQRITMAEAIKAGLQPCKICKPPVAYGSAPSPHKEQGTSQTAQCKGFTKSGTRCKHMTRIANGYCYQHQPG